MATRTGSSAPAVIFTDSATLAVALGKPFPSLLTSGSGAYRRSIKTDLGAAQRTVLHSVVTSQVGGPSPHRGSKATPVPVVDSVVG